LGHSKSLSKEKLYFLKRKLIHGPTYSILAIKYILSSLGLKGHIGLLTLRKALLNKKKISFLKSSKEQIPLKETYELKKIIGLKIINLSWTIMTKDQRFTSQKIITKTSL